MQPIKLGNFMVGTYQGRVSIEKVGEGNPLDFAAGEYTQIKELLGIALSMESISHLPEHIDLQLFTIKFHEDNFLTLCAQDREGEVNFTWLEGDELITRVDDGYKMAMNEREVGAAGMKPVSNYSDSGEPYL